MCSGAWPRNGPLSSGYEIELAVDILNKAHRDHMRCPQPLRLQKLSHNGQISSSIIQRRAAVFCFDIAVSYAFAAAIRTGTS